MILLIDDREKAPFLLPPPSAPDAHGLAAETRRVRLATGDYSLAGLEALVAVERKTPRELYHTVGSGRARFEHELQRMRAMLDRGGRAAIVVEGSLYQICEAARVDSWALTRRGLAMGARHVTARTVTHSLAHWSGSYGVPILFAGSLELAQEVAWSFLLGARNALGASSKLDRGGRHHAD